MSTRVVIVGAGVCGLSTAWHLRELAADPLDITVLDMAHPGAGTSGLSVGMVETQFSSADAIETRAYGRRFLDRFCAESGLTFTRSGYLRLGCTEEDLAAFERSVRLQAAFGIHDAEILVADEIARAWPDLQLDESVRAGLFGRSDGHVDSFELCSLLAQQLRADGVRLVSSSRLTDAERTASGSWRLRSGDGELEADVVVNAAGPWAPEVATLLGTRLVVSDQLYGVIVANLAQEPVRPLPFVMDYIPGSGRPGLYFRQEGGGQLIAGLHSEDGNFQAATPSLLPGTLDDESIVLIVEQLAERVKGVDDARISASWTGTCAMTADGHPVVGLAPGCEGVVNAAGSGASGIQLAPAIGRQAAEALLGLPSSLRPDHPWNTGAPAAPPGSPSPTARSSST